MDVIERCETMRIAREKVLNGKTPRQRGEEKTLTALDWIYRWGWSSPSTVELIGGAKRSGLAARLVRNGLLLSTKTESGGGVRGVPTSILTLTRLGLEEIERFREVLLPYQLDPFRIRQDKLRHDQLAQHLTAKGLLQGTLQDFHSEIELAQRSAAAVKQPDVLWVLPDGQRCAVEIELSAKWGRDLDGFVRGCLLALASREERPARFNFVAVVSDSPAIIKRYQAAFSPGARYGVWQKDERRHWQKTADKTVPDWVEGRMLWRLIESK